MKTQPANFILSACRHQAFSLIELLTAVSLMTVIIFALYAMFDHAQKALRGSVSQTDVLESGRAAMELIKRDLEQLTASRGSNVPNFYVQMNTNAIPFAQSRPADLLRTNRLQDFLFLSKFNNSWTVSGYHVLPLQLNSPIGSLGRFTTNTVSAAEQFRFISKSIRSDAAEQLYYQPVIDGVVSLTLRPLDRNGNLMVRTNGPQTLPRTFFYFGSPEFQHARYYFLSNSLPAYIDVELGILEPHVVSQYRAMADNQKVAANYLAQQAAKVHLFHERIPIRTVSR